MTDNPSSPWKLVTPGHVLIALALTAFCFWQWQTAHDDLVKVESKIAQTETDRKAELADLQTKLEAIKHDQQVTKTPEQVVSKLPQYIPLPQPIIYSHVGGKQSDPPVVTIPPADIQPLFTFATDCASCKLKLQQDQAQIAQLTAERDTALKAAKSGGFLRRTGTALKYVAIGAGLGATIAKF